MFLNFTKKRLNLISPPNYSQRNSVSSQTNLKPLAPLFAKVFKLIKTLSLLLIISTFSNGFAATMQGQTSYWSCKAQDTHHQIWHYQSSYKRKAINHAFSLCKKHSKAPHSCTTSHEGCAMIIKGKQLKHLWHCLALDKTGGHYRSDYFRTRNNAIEGAKSICRHKSSSPRTCYVRIMTCKNDAL